LVSNILAITRPVRLCLIGPSMTTGKTLNMFLHAARQRLEQAGGGDGLAPPCEDAWSFARGFYRKVGTSLPDDYITLLREFDGLIVQDVEYFGSRRRLLRPEDADHTAEKIAISSILEANVGTDRAKPGKRKMILLGRWEGGLF